MIRSPRRPMAVADQYGCGVYVVTVDDMADYIDPDTVTETGETGMAAFTEYAWDALGLAASYDSNGIMLALSMAERDFQMLAHGDTANAAFTDYGKYIMQDEFLDNFREDDWYGGFADYIAACGPLPRGQRQRYADRRGAVRRNRGGI